MQVICSPRSLAVATMVGPAWGWGRLGHRVAGKIAEDRLTPTARAAVRDLLEPGESLADVSTWADEVRRDHPESGPWHYINVPITEPKYDRKFEPKEGCVVVKVEDFRKILADPTAPEARTSEGAQVPGPLRPGHAPAGPRRPPRRPGRQRPPGPVLRRGVEPPPGLGLGLDGARRPSREGVGRDPLEVDHARAGRPIGQRADRSTGPTRAWRSPGRPIATRSPRPR